MTGTDPVSELTVEDVAAYVDSRRHRAPWPLALDRITLMPGGERNLLASLPPLHGPAPSLLVKFPRAVDERSRARARREAEALAVLPSTTGPRLYWFDEAGVRGVPMLVMERVPGRARALPRMSADRAGQLGQVLARVHGSAPPFGEPGEADLAAVLEERVTSEVDRRLVVAQEHGIPAVTRAAARFLDRYALVLRPIITGLAGRAFAEGPLALCHGDLGEGNVLWPPVGPPLFIDWEDARVADPAEEIAYLFAENALEAGLRSAIRAGYESTAGDDLRLWQRVRYYQPLVALGSATWWLRCWARRLHIEATGGDTAAHPRRPDYYRRHMRRRLAQVDAELRLSLAGNERDGGLLAALAARRLP